MSSKRMMRAIRKTGTGPGLAVEEIPTPEPGPADVLIQVEAASICGTDLHIYRWDEWAQQRIRPPLTIGHELAGTVVAVGRDVRGVAEGDFVSAESHITCGHCFQCRTGQAHMCPHTKIIGVDCDGAFAEYVRLPESVIWLNDRAKLSPEVASLQEPFGNAVFALSPYDLPGHSVAVFGCGPIGLFAIGIVKASGAAGVWASDIQPFRLDLARRMGALDVVNAAEHEGGVPAWFREQNEGYGLDIGIEMSGAAQAVRDVFETVRNGGRVTLFGIPSRPVEIDIAEKMIFKNLTVFAINGRKIFETWYRTRWLLESGVVDVRPLITEVRRFDDIDEAMEQLASGRACKIVLRPNGKPAVSTVPQHEHEPEAAEVYTIPGHR